MGVRGLTTYINKNENIFLKYHLLHNSQLIIDGHSLGAQLYAGLNSFSAFGGDYDRYAAYVKKFFQQLQKCNIKCYVLFDGGHESRKLKTAFNRLRAKIYGASRLDPVTQSNLNIFPLFLRDVFKNVLQEIKIPYTVCEFEADDEIAAMARFLNCPVLSYDSDFFIYNVLYIPFNMLESKPKVIENGDKKIFGMECRMYKVENLLDHFGGLKDNMLPLLATLLGNDFVQKRVFKKFFSHLKLPRCKKGKKANEQQRSILGVLKWLQNETMESAIEKILGRVKKQQKRKLYFIIKKSIDGYNKTYCRSLQYFGFDATPDNVTIMSIDKYESNLETDLECKQDSDIEDDTCSTTSEDSSHSVVVEDDTQDNIYPELPNWISVGIRQGFVPQLYINLYTHKLYFCSPQAEDYTQDDSFLCALPLLRYGFDILTDFKLEDFIFVSREQVQYRRIVIGRDYGISNPYDINDNIITHTDKLPLYFKHFINEKFHNLDVNIIAALPENYQLFMISILWWITKCNIPIAYVYSLFLCYIMLEVVDEKTGMCRGHNYFHNKHSKKLEELRRRPNEVVESTEIFLNKNKVLYEDCLLVASQLVVCFELSAEIKKRPKSYDSRQVHAFAQFQCCLQQFNYLSTICRSTYVNCNIYNSLNGTFLYNVTKRLEGQDDPLCFIEQNMLKGAHTVLWYFKSLCSIFDQCVTQLGIVTPKVIGKKRNRRKNKGKGSDLDCVEFESEVFI